MTDEDRAHLDATRKRVEQYRQALAFGGNRIPGRVFFDCAACGSGITMQIPDDLPALDLLLRLVDDRDRLVREAWALGSTYWEHDEDAEVARLLGEFDVCTQEGCTAPPVRTCPTCQEPTCKRHLIIMATDYPGISEEYAICAECLEMARSTLRHNPYALCPACGQPLGEQSGCPECGAPETPRTP